MLLVERPLQNPIPEVPARIPVEINLLKPTEVSEYVEFRPDTKAAEVQSQLDAGHWCFVARHQGRIVCARWAAKSRVWIDYLSCELHLAADEVYSYGLFTSPEFRGSAISPAASTAMLRYFHAAGYRRIVGVIGPENRASLRSVEKTGYHTYGVMGYVNIGPWRWDFCRGKKA
jgi:RimJ/RimL family protein N-acetyltransferase